MSLVCDVKLPDGRVCGYSGSNNPAMLGRHKRFTHGISGKAHLSAKAKKEAAMETAVDPTDLLPFRCKYCPEAFATDRGRSRHRTTMHPDKPKHGKEAAPAVLTLDKITETVINNPKRGYKTNGASRNQETTLLTFTQEEFDHQQAVANAAGYLEAKADELASRNGYVPRDFTRQCIEIIRRSTLR